MTINFTRFFFFNKIKSKKILKAHSQAPPPGLLIHLDQGSGLRMCLFNEFTAHANAVGLQGPTLEKSPLNLNKNKINVSGNAITITGLRNYHRDHQAKSERKHAPLFPRTWT